MPETARRIVLASRPVGEPKPSDFRLEEFPVPQASSGQLLLRTKWLSLDPYMRGRMSDAPSYAKPVGIDEVMEGGTVNEVAASNNDSYKPGDIEAIGITASPCGGCRQWLYEFRIGEVTFLNSAGELATYSAAELLPDTWDLPA